MVLAWLILTLSGAMLFFYFQAACQKILRRPFERESFQSIASVIRLEFPSLRESLDAFSPRVDFHRLRAMLQCDFRALTYLLKNVPNPNRHSTHEERLLTLYFHWQLLSLSVRRLLNTGERKAILRLTSVLEYFANLVGQRLNTVGCVNLTAAGQVPSL